MARFIPDGAIELFFDNSKKFETTSSGGTITGALTTNNGGGNAVLGSHLDLGDNQKVRYGASDDLQIFHDGTDSFIDNSTGNLKIIAPNNVEAIKVFNDGTVNIGGNADNVRLRFGIGSDLQIYHDGSHSRLVDSGTGFLVVQSSRFQINNAANTENMAAFIENGAVELYFDNSKKLETTSAGVTIEGSQHRFKGDVRFDNNTNTERDIFFDESEDRLNFFDNVKATFGNSNDLQIFHNGTDSLITDTGTGSLALGGSAVFIQNAAHNANMASFVAGAEANLFFDGNKKFETTSTGVKVTGSAFFPDGSEISLGNSSDLIIRHIAGSRHEILGGASASLQVRCDETLFLSENGNEDLFRAVKNGAFAAYFDGSKKFETTSTGVTVSSSGDPILTVTGSGHAKLNLTSTSGTDHCGVNFGDSSDENAGMIQYTNSINAMQFHANGSERMRILSDGAVCINSTVRPVVGTEFLGVQGGSASNSIGIAATASHNEGIPFFASNSSNNFACRLMRFAAGSGGDTRGTIIFNGTAMVYGGTSDYRLKENITQITNGITKLKTLNPINFNWIKDETNTSIMGFLAHEVQEVMPEAVAGKKDAVDSKGEEDYQEMDYGRISPLIVAALQELVTKVEVLETEVAALKAG